MRNKKLFYLRVLILPLVLIAVVIVFISFEYHVGKWLLACAYFVILISIVTAGLFLSKRTH
jgi:hypothetical protein